MSSTKMCGCEWSMFQSEASLAGKCFGCGSLPECEDSEFTSRRNYVQTGTNFCDKKCPLCECALWHRLCAECSKCSADVENARSPSKYYF